jgi:hypothetical protein
MCSPAAPRPDVVIWDVAAARSVDPAMAPRRVSLEPAGAPTAARGRPPEELRELIAG